MVQERLIHNTSTRSAFPFLHLVTDASVVGGRDFLARAAAAVAAGGSELALHLRAPGLCGRRLFELAVALERSAGSAGSLLLVNDRCDVALTAGANGVHLPEQGLSAVVARRLIGPEMWLGRSVHEDSTVGVDVVEALDFLIVGAVFSTRSHPGRTPGGPGLFTRFGHLGLPLVGIGGITVERAAEVRRAGAAGIAVVGGVWGATDPAAAIQQYRSAWSESL